MDLPGASEESPREKVDALGPGVEANGANGANGANRARTFPS